MNNIKELVDKAYDLEAQLRKTKNEVDDALKKIEKEVADALNSGRVSLLSGKQVCIDYIPDGAVMRTIKNSEGREFDCYEAEVDGVTLVHYSDYREATHE